jgi:hypothetical protein
MTTSKLPARPSLESLRKQAKKLARAIAAGDQWPSPGRVLAGAVVAPSVCEGLIHSRARKLIDLFERRGLLPLRGDIYGMTLI